MGLIILAVCYLIVAVPCYRHLKKIEKTAGSYSTESALYTLLIAPFFTIGFFILKVTKWLDLENFKNFLTKDQDFRIIIYRN